MLYGDFDEDYLSFGPVSITGEGVNATVFGSKEEIEDLVVFFCFIVSAFFNGFDMAD